MAAVAIRRAREAPSFSSDLSRGGLWNDWTLDCLANSAGSIAVAGSMACAYFSETHSIHASAKPSAGPTMVGALVPDAGARARRSLDEQHASVTHDPPHYYNDDHNLGASNIAYLMGAEALAKVHSNAPGFGPNPATVVSPVVDKLRRFASIGWYHLVGYSVFRPEALIRIETAATLRP